MKAAIPSSPVLLSIVLSISLLSARSEKQLKRKDVPQPVIASFEKTYPNAKATGFSVETENGNKEYEVESTDGPTRRDITFDPQGVIISIEETLGSKDLPDSVRTAFSKGYSKAKILKCEKVTERGVTTYELQVQSGKWKLELVYSPAGALVRTEKK